jgi:hypothetical protein
MAKAEPRSITRRSLVAAFALPLIPALLPRAGVPALATPDVASAFAKATADGAAPSGLPPQPDPIFAAIESHRGAYAALDAFIPELADIEQAAWHAPRGKRRAANRRLKEAYAEERRLGDALSDAADRFAATVAQTLPGAAAALAYVREHHAQGYPMCDEEEDIMTLLASTEAAICRAAGLPAPRREAREG